jgi:hypothetical protein
MSCCYHVTATPLQADGFLGFEDDGGEGREEGGLPDVLCQRCFSLRHAG